MHRRSQPRAWRDKGIVLKRVISAIAGAALLATRIGGVLLLASLVAGIMIGLAQSGHWTFGDTSPVGLGSMGVLALAGIGVLLVAFGGQEPFDRRGIRASLATLGLGALGVLGAAIRGGMLNGDAMGDLLAVSLFLVGMALLLAGLVGTAIGLAARRSALSLGAAVAIVGGIVAVFLTAWVSADLAIVGFTLILLGLAGTGLIAVRVPLRHRQT